MNIIETDIDRASRLPLSAFGIVALWTIVELAILWLMMNGNFTGQGETLHLFLGAIMLSGLMASTLMVCGWLLLRAKPRTSRFGWEKLRQSGFDCAICMIPIAVLVISTIDRGVPARLDIVASLLMFFTGAYVTLLVYRSYFRPRLYRAGESFSSIDGSNRVSIREIMLLTGLVALALASCRWLVGSLRPELILAGVVGMVLALNWLVTSLWILGGAMFFLAMGGLVLTEVLGLGFVVYLDESARWDDAFGAIIAVSGLQLHMMLFLGALRASDYRLWCPRSR
jgi:hypothetical protein